MNRRHLLQCAAIGASMLALRPGRILAGVAGDTSARLASLERAHGGRLGVSILDTQSGRAVSHRGGERFLLCSTFKLLAVAAVLARVDRGEERLERRIVFGREALLDYAPVTRAHTGAPGMSMAELCDAAITLSDNTAANLLLDSLGGPSRVTAFVRTLGDRVTRLDRTEPSLNAGRGSGDVRDTTTPDAMLASVRRLVLGDVLTEASRARLRAWLQACTTGTDRLRAGVPAGWVVADKTGSGSHGETNDVAVFFQPQRKPVLVTAYYAGSHADAASRASVLAEVGRIAAEPGA